MVSCDNFVTHELYITRQQNYCCCGIVEARNGALVISICWALLIFSLGVAGQSIIVLSLLAAPFSCFVGYFFEIHYLYLPIIFLQMFFTALNVIFLFLTAVGVSFIYQDDIYNFLRLHQPIVVPFIVVLIVLSLFHFWLTSTLAAAYRSVRDTRLLALERYAKTPVNQNNDDEVFFKPIILNV